MNRQRRAFLKKAGVSSVAVGLSSLTAIPATASHKRRLELNLQGGGVRYYLKVASNDMNGVKLEDHDSITHNATTSEATGYLFGGRTDVYYFDGELLEMAVRHHSSYDSFTGFDGTVTEDVESGPQNRLRFEHASGGDYFDYSATMSGSASTRWDCERGDDAGNGTIDGSLPEGDIDTYDVSGAVVGFHVSSSDYGDTSELRLTHYTA